MRDLFGFYYDPTTKQLFDENGVEQAFTFEPVSGNPLNFATPETAERVRKIVSNWVPGWEPTVGPPDKPWVHGPFHQELPELMLHFSKGEQKAEFNAGLIANSIIRQGFREAENRFLAEFGTAFKEEN